MKTQENTFVERHAVAYCWRLTLTLLNLLPSPISDSV